MFSVVWYEFSDVSDNKNKVGIFSDPEKTPKAHFRLFEKMKSGSWIGRLLSLSL